MSEACVMERPIGRDLLRLVRTGQKVHLQLLLRTRRRKSPYDVFVVADMSGPGDGLTVRYENARIAPYDGRIRSLLPDFDSAAVVEAVSAR